MINRTDEELGIRLESAEDLNIDASINLIQDVLRNAYNSLVDDLVWLDKNQDKYDEIYEKGQKYLYYKKCRKDYYKRIEYEKRCIVDGVKPTPRTKNLKDRMRFYLEHKKNPPIALTSNERVYLDKYHKTIMDKDKTIAFYNSETFKIYTLGVIDKNIVLKRAYQDASDRINIKCAC